MVVNPDPLIIPGGAEQRAQSSAATAAGGYLGFHFHERCPLAPLPE